MLMEINSLKQKINEMTQDFSDLESKHGQLNKNLNEIQNELKDALNKNVVLIVFFILIKIIFFRKKFLWTIKSTRKKLLI